MTWLGVKGDKKKHKNKRKSAFEMRTKEKGKKDKKHGFTECDSMEIGCFNIYFEKENKVYSATKRKEYVINYHTHTFKLVFIFKDYMTK